MTRNHLILIFIFFAGITCAEQASLPAAGQYDTILSHETGIPELTLPEFRINEFYWNEDGRRNISQITRIRNDLCMEFPFLPDLPKTRLEATHHLWQENTPIEKDTRQSRGITFAENTAFNEYISLMASYTLKMYLSDGFTDTDSGMARLSLKILERTALELGFERSDEIYNYFGMMQGLQADQWTASLSSGITPALEVKGSARYMEYSDNNRGMHFMARAGYAFTDFPRIFRITLCGEYRDTRDNYLELYFNDPRMLVNIIHPYWCPRNYNTETIVFDWFHDISGQQHRDSGSHFYNVLFSIGTDSENNPAASLQIEWGFHFLNHFAAGLKGMIYRSEEWDAESAFANLGYRF